MGVGELMARVVSGIEIPGAAAGFAFLGVSGALTARADAWGAAAVAVLRLTSAVSPRASAAMTGAVFHRICMKTSPVRAAVLNHIAGAGMPPMDERCTAYPAGWFCVSVCSHDSR